MVVVFFVVVAVLKFKVVAATETLDKKSQNSENKLVHQPLQTKKSIGLLTTAFVQSGTCIQNTEICGVTCGVSFAKRSHFSRGLRKT